MPQGNEPQENEPQQDMMQQDWQPEYEQKDEQQHHHAQHHAQNHAPHSAVSPFPLAGVRMASASLFALSQSPTPSPGSGLCADRECRSPFSGPAQQQKRAKKRPRTKVSRKTRNKKGKTVHHQRLPSPAMPGMAATNTQYQPAWMWRLSGSGPLQSNVGSSIGNPMVVLKQQGEVASRGTGRRPRAQPWSDERAGGTATATPWLQISLDMSDPKGTEYDEAAFSDPRGIFDDATSMSFHHEEFAGASQMGPQQPSGVVGDGD
ncbi:hypothetical protein GGR56DRAFT_670087 [Xylariaceae sp. FL0804]|nr:hypothetical protein GGR56DRAFT_670087 [Xylariaceae sp. FL0804]